MSSLITDDLSFILSSVSISFVVFSITFLIIHKVCSVVEFPTKYNYLIERPDNYNFNSRWLDKLSAYENDEIIIKVMDEFCKRNDIYKNGAIVSLSGGVDSMVTLSALIYLRTKHNFPIFTASIDYGLREESSDECQFLNEYTDFFNVKAYISKVTNVSRKKDNKNTRSEFEEESRLIRFDTYKQIVRENFLNLTNVGVFVAHHQDDIIENIFTNIMRGGDLLDLEVMRETSVIHGVTIFRPFLSLKKEVIYNFAHKYDVPYFLDTTPTWSRRGKMRNEIFPLLDNVFGIDWHNKLKYIGSQSNECGSYITNFIINPWFEKVTFLENNNYILIPIENHPTLIYSKLLMKILHCIGQSMIKRTSMEKIMKLIENPILNKGKEITLDKNRYAKILNNNLVITTKCKIS